MIGKIGILAGALFAALPFPLEAPTVGNNDPLIARVECNGTSGSAARIGRYTWVSVAHVTSADNCKVAGEPLQNLWHDPDRDFSIFWLAPRPGPGLTVDCDGFRIGRLYRATGHARGLPEQTSVSLVAVGAWRGFARLLGIFAVIPGQSGGAVTDRITGKIVGMVNVYNAAEGAAGSIPLSETHLCRSA